MKDVARLRIKLAFRDDVLALLTKANIEVVGLEDRGDGEARIEIPSRSADYSVLASIPIEWWSIRGFVE